MWNPQQKHKYHEEMIKEINKAAKNDYYRNRDGYYNGVYGRVPLN